MHSRKKSVVQILVVVVLSALATILSIWWISGAKGSRDLVLLRTDPNPSGIVVASSVGPGILSSSSKGCVTLDGQALVVSADSTINARSDEVEIARLGKFKLGSRMPATYGYTREFTENNLPKEYAQCGPGTYAFISGPPA